MTKEIKTLVKYRLSRSKEAFKDGVLLFENNSLNSSINRFYYAAYYAARALLAIKDLDSSKHSGVISLFQQHFVKTGIISIDLSKALPRSFEKRLDSDYEDFVNLNKREVEDTKEKVALFIEACEKATKDLFKE